MHTQSLSLILVSSCLINQKRILTMVFCWVGFLNHFYHLKQGAVASLSRIVKRPFCSGKFSLFALRRNDGLSPNRFLGCVCKFGCTTTRMTSSAHYRYQRYCSLLYWLQDYWPFGHWKIEKSELNDVPLLPKNLFRQWLHNINVLQSSRCIR